MSLRTLQIDDRSFHYVLAHPLREHPAQVALNALAVALELPDEGHALACDISDETAHIGRPFRQQAGVAQKTEPALVRKRRAQRQ